MEDVKRWKCEGVERREDKYGKKGNRNRRRH
jgi:hypothetical protein